MRRSTVRQKRERLQEAARAAAAGDSTAAKADGAAAEAGQQAWSEVSEKFDVLAKDFDKIEKINLNTKIPVETAKMAGNALGKFDVEDALQQARGRAQVRVKMKLKEVFIVC
eukprot:COSAG02_NODE_877_length_16272_cov_8.002288_2_plen_112_part_00